MQIFPKTKGFCNKQVFFRKKKLTLFNKTTFTFLEKNSNPLYWVLEKTRFMEKKIEISGASFSQIQCI